REGIGATVGQDVAEGHSIQPLSFGALSGGISGGAAPFLGPAAAGADAKRGVGGAVQNKGTSKTEIVYNSKEIAFAHHFYIRAAERIIKKLTKPLDDKIDVLEKGEAELKGQQGFNPLGTIASAVGGLLTGGYVGAAVGVAGSILGGLSKDASI